MAVAPRSKDALVMSGKFHMLIFGGHLCVSIPARAARAHLSFLSGLGEIDRHVHGVVTVHPPGCAWKD